MIRTSARPRTSWLPSAPPWTLPLLQPPPLMPPQTPLLSRLQRPSNMGECTPRLLPAPQLTVEAAGRPTDPRCDSVVDTSAAPASDCCCGDATDPSPINAKVDGLGRLAELRVDAINVRRVNGFKCGSGLRSVKKVKQHGTEQASYELIPELYELRVSGLTQFVRTERIFKMRDGRQKSRGKNPRRCICTRLNFRGTASAPKDIHPLSPHS